MSRLKSAVNGYMEKRFTTEHMSASQVIAIIIPVFVEHAFAVLFGILNTAMISGSGMNAMSAVGMVDSLNLFVQQMFISLASGGTVVIAQYRGAGNPDMVSRAASQSISAVTLMGGALGAVLIAFNGPVLNALFGAAEPEVMELAQLYLIGSCVRYAMIGATSGISGALRGIGKTKPALMLSVVFNITTLAFNILFITILGWGVKGLITASLLSYVIGTVVHFVYVCKYDKELGFGFKKSVSFEKRILKKLMMLAIPFAMENVFFQGGKLLTQTFIVGMGTASVAVNVVCNSLMSLVQLPGGGYNTANVTIVGQCIGRGDEEAARKYVHSMVKLTSLSSGIVAVLMIAVFPLWVVVYNIDASVVNQVFLITVILGFAQTTVWSRGFIIPGGLRAAGDATFTSVSALLSMWLVRVVAGYVAGVVLGLGIVGVWGAMCFEWAARAIIYSFRLKGKAWTKHRIVD